MGKVRSKKDGVRRRRGEVGYFHLLPSHFDLF
jgi:hypothetical protein